MPNKPSKESRQESQAAQEVRFEEWVRKWIDAGGLDRALADAEARPEMRNE